MNFAAAVLILVTLAFMASIFVWLMSKVQARARAHYRAMIAVAGQHELKFVDDTDPNVRLRLKGEVDGVKLTLFSVMVQGARSRHPTTQVTAERPRDLPKGGQITRPGMGRKLQVEGEDSGHLSEQLRDGQVRRAFEAVTDPLWAGTAGSGRLDDEGIHLVKGGFIGDEAILSEMVSRAVAAAQAMASEK